MPNLSEKQLENLTYFKENLSQFLVNPMLKNKFVIVYNKKIENSFDTFENAFSDAASKYPRNEFIIQQVISTSDVVNFLFMAKKTV